MLDHALRHLALRLWLTVFIGGLGSLVLVPPLQALMGLGWVTLPVILFLGLIYLGLGWALNAWTGRQIEGLRAEGAVWERAGMRREATQRYEALMGLVDSFLLSPRRRREAQARLLPSLTRFYLDQEEGGPVLDRLLRAHLEAHADDAQVAARWLRLQVGVADPPPWSHDLAQRIGEALSDSAEINALLARFYLGCGRSDHAAVDLYRRHWQATPGFRKARAVHLAQLLSMEEHRDPWALEVYLTAWSRGAPEAELRPLVQRCLTNIAATEETSALLTRARELMGSTLMPEEAEPAAVVPPADAASTASIGDTFAMEPPTELDDVVTDPDLAEEAAFIYHRRRSGGRPALGAWMGRVGQEMGNRLLAFGPRMGGLAQGFYQQLRRPWGKALGLGVIAMALILLITNTVAHLRSGASPPPPPEPVAAPAVTDPFTIQVAAYLKAEDAKAYAAQLKAKELAAYWTEAVGASRSWYQVRIDHFATKAAARKFGQDLKAKGLINDFYVANYRPPQPPEKK
jgi:hypothetical protein